MRELQSKVVRYRLDYYSVKNSKESKNKSHGRIIKTLRHPYLKL